MIRGFFYRLLMRVAHHYHWHYAPPIYPEGDVQLWCQWCGFRQTIKRRDNAKVVRATITDLGKAAPHIHITDDDILVEP